LTVLRVNRFVRQAEDLQPGNAHSGLSQIARQPVSDRFGPAPMGLRPEIAAFVRARIVQHLVGQLSVGPRLEGPSIVLLAAMQAASRFGQRVALPGIGLMPAEPREGQTRDRENSACVVNFAQAQTREPPPENGRRASLLAEMDRLQEEADLRGHPARGKIVLGSIARIPEAEPQAGQAAGR